MHIKTGLLDSKGNFRPCNSKVLESIYKATIKSRIREGFTIRGKFGTSIYKSARVLAIKHASTIEKINNILTLGKEKIRGVTKNRNAQKMMKQTEIIHGEFRAKKSDNVI